VTCEEVLCLTLGHETVPRRVSLEGGGDAPLREPVIGVLARTTAGWALLDTGLAPEPLARGLRGAGVAVADLALVAVSHLHLDHAGGLALVAGGPPVAVQRRELAFARTPAALEQAYRPEHWAGPVRWREVDGDAPLAPGIDAVATPGHTPGHMSYRVRTPGRTWLFAMDAIDLQEGIDTGTPIGSSADPADAPLRRTSHERLVALAAAEGARLVPGHCPVTWPPAGLRAVAV
jgi:N-acyl homoserine lactone hydrolase